MKKEGQKKVYMPKTKETEKNSLISETKRKANVRRSMFSALKDAGKSEKRKPAYNCTFDDISVRKNRFWNHYLNNMVVAILLFVIFICTGCGGADTSPDLSSLGEVHVVSRENGSGTKDVLCEKLKTDDIAAAKTVQSTEEMLQAVAADKNAVGYVAVSALPAYMDTESADRNNAWAGSDEAQEIGARAENLVQAEGDTVQSIGTQTENPVQEEVAASQKNSLQTDADLQTGESEAALSMDGVKVLQVGGIAPDASMIRQELYPYCRNEYLAYGGRLSDAARDFLNYVLSAGQKIVGTYGSPVKQSSPFISFRYEGTIKISGSSSMAPMLCALAEDYKAYNPNAKIEITVTDSTKGVTAAVCGECDFAMVSRELMDYEEELLEKKAIARDGVAVIVNSENPVENLTKKQVKRLFSGACTRWEEL